MREFGETEISDEFSCYMERDVAFLWAVNPDHEVGTTNTLMVVED